MHRHPPAHHMQPDQEVALINYLLTQVSMDQGMLTCHSCNKSQLVTHRSLQKSGLLILFTLHSLKQDLRSGILTPCSCQQPYPQQHNPTATALKFLSPTACKFHRQENYHQDRSCVNQTSHACSRLSRYDIIWGFDGQ